MKKLFVEGSLRPPALMTVFFGINDAVLPGESSTHVALHLRSCSNCVAVAVSSSAYTASIDTAAAPVAFCLHARTGSMCRCQNHTNHSSASTCSKVGCTQTAAGQALHSTCSAATE
eukprot:15202-Heterococcus_DN1.PRE.2